MSGAGSPERIARPVFSGAAIPVQRHGRPPYAACLSYTSVLLTDVSFRKAASIQLMLSMLGRPIMGSLRSCPGLSLNHRVPSFPDIKPARILFFLASSSARQLRASLAVFRGREMPSAPPVMDLTFRTFSIKMLRRSSVAA